MQVVELRNIITERKNSLDGPVVGRLMPTDVHIPISGTCEYEKFNGKGE